MEKITDIETIEQVKNETIKNSLEEKKADIDVESLMKQFTLMQNEMQAQIKEQAEIIAKQNKAIAQMSEKNINEITQSGNATVNNDLLDALKALKNNKPTLDMVKVMYLEDSHQAMFKLQNGRMIKFTHYGQIVPVSMADAILLINEYNNTFKRGALRFDEDHMYMLVENGIDVDSIDYKPMDSIKNFNNLDISGVEKLYSSLQVFQREMLKSYIVKEIKKDKIDDAFIDKIKALNKLSKKDSIDGKTGTYEYILSKLSEIDK
jgi:hypothetical protein